VTVEGRDVIPNSVASIVFLIICALPGYVYHQQRQRTAPIVTQSVVQELLSIVFVGALVDILAIALLAVPWRLLPDARPDVPALLSSSGTYVSGHVTLILLWSAVALMLAIGLGWFFGTRAGERWLPAKARTWLQGWRRANMRQPAWHLLFTEHPGKTVYAGCTLDDGSWIRGRVHSYSRIATEDADRELTLTEPIAYRAPGDDDLKSLDHVDAVAISASRLVLLTVTYHDPPAPAPTPTPTPTPNP
jgi:uncharacterized protein DUF6338